MKKDTAKQKELKRKLKAYVALSGAVAIGSVANAQLVYTDIDPDTLISQDGEYYDLDLNNDGIIDLKFQIAKDLTPHNKNFLANLDIPNNNYAISSSGYVAALSAGNPISSSSMGKNNVLAGFYSYSSSSSSTYSDSSGNFKNVQDKYIGVQFKIAGGNHFGWIRLDVGLDKTKDSVSIKIKDFAYQAVPNASIKAGATENIVTMPATELVITDIANNYNASDFQISFTAPAMEGDSIAQYYAFAVKAENANNFTLAEAEAGTLINNYCVNVSPDGSDTYTFSPFPTAKDIDGDAIIYNRDYKFFILSKADFNKTTESSLSEASDAASIDAPETVVYDITANDIADNGNGMDMEVSFKKAANETDITEYRIMAVPEGTPFDLATADVVVSSRYTTLSPTGSDITQVLTATTLDVDGNLIVNSQNYNIYVLSIVTAPSNVLSLKSDIIRLEVTPPAISDLHLGDIGNSNTYRDIQFSFKVPSDTSNISSYRLFLVKSENAADFDLNAANASGNYLSIGGLKADSTINDTIKSHFNDTDGSSIQSGIAYKAFVLSIKTADATINALSEPTDLILHLDVTKSFDIAAAKSGDNGNASDITLFFNYFDNRLSTLKELRVLAVKDEDSDMFDLSAANMVDTANSIIIPKSTLDVDKKSELFRLDLKADSKDVDGDTITSNIAYRFYILSVADGVVAVTNYLAKPSEIFTMENVNIKEELNNLNISAYSTGKQIVFKTNDVAWENAAIKILSITGQTIYTDNLSSNNHTISLDVNAGIYIVKVISNEQVFTKKLFVE